MKEYLKMSDAFLGKAINSNGEVVVNKYKDVDYGEYVCHAINSHDELVAEVYLLRTAVKGSLVYGLCAGLDLQGCKVDDLVRD